MMNNFSILRPASGQTDTNQTNCAIKLWWKLEKHMLHHSGMRHFSKSVTDRQTNWGSKNYNRYLDLFISVAGTWFILLLPARLISLMLVRLSKASSSTLVISLSIRSRDLQQNINDEDDQDQDYLPDSSHWREPGSWHHLEIVVTQWQTLEVGHSWQRRWSQGHNVVVTQVQGCQGTQTWSTHTQCQHYVLDFSSIQ